MINSCKAGLGKIVRNNLVLEELQKCWSEHFRTELDQFMKADAALLTVLIWKLITSLASRFPNHNILALFGIFDPKDISDEVEERADYGDMQIEKLCTKFKLLETTTRLHCRSFIKFVYNFPSLKAAKLLDICTSRCFCRRNGLPCTRRSSN